MIRAVHSVAIAGIVYRSGMARAALVDLVSDMTVEALLVKRP